MKFSLVNGKKTEPFSKGKGICVACGNATQAKCGHINIWHWAHCSKKICDNWWGNETAWHREWKSYWSIHFQEVVHFDLITGEKHIADVKNGDDIVIEFQNSPISYAELASRESFYTNLVWVVNAEKFKSNIQFCSKLPNPDNPKSNDMAIYAPKVQSSEFIYYLHSEREPNMDMVEIYGSHRIQEFIEATHMGHYLFLWKNPRSVWFTSTKPVFFDFGENLLLELVKFNNCSAFCLKGVHRKKFILLYGGQV